MLGRVVPGRGIAPKGHGHAHNFLGKFSGRSRSGRSRPWTRSRSSHAHARGAHVLGHAHARTLAPRAHVSDTLPFRDVLTFPLVAAAPFTLLRDMNSFGLTSAFGVFVNAFVVIVLCYEAADKLMQERTAAIFRCTRAYLPARSAVVSSHVRATMLTPLSHLYT